MAEQTGQRVGEYEVLAQLGSGGMGRVFKVRNVISNREEAMKILLPDLASDPELAARFMAEIRTVAGLEHPGIAQLRTAFEFHNQFVMVMEYVEGTTLERLAAQTRIPLSRVLDYSSQVLAALSFAHSRGVTHRDIKPANIMITTHGLIKLMDFGIAKSTNDMQLTRPGTTMGSVYYMSPEQVRGGPIDARSDLYSFGVTLYEMLTGRKPFQADTSYSVLNAQLHESPTPPLDLDPSISPVLNGIVLKALAKAPEERFQSADEFRSALRTLVEHEAVAAPQDATPATAQAQGAVSPPSAFAPVPTPQGLPPRTRSGNRGLWIGLGAATALLALIAVAVVLPRMFATHAGQRAAATGTSEASSARPIPTSSGSTAQAAATQPVEAPPVAQRPVLTPASAQATAPVGGGSDSHPRHEGGIGELGARPLQDASAAGPFYRPGQRPPQVAATETAPLIPQGGPSSREVRDAHDRYANLEARADAALEGVQQIRSQQQAQGMDIRGDILAATNRLRHQLNEANRALAQRDLESAGDYLNKAEDETAVLERFLGR